MNSVRVALYAVGAVLVALLVGFLWGHSGKAAAEADLRDVQVRLDLAEVRAALLGARVDLFEVNFGRAAQHLQVARSQLDSAASRLNEAGDRAAQLKGIRSRITQAQEQAGRLDQSANTTLAGALADLDRLVDASAREGRKTP